VKELIRDDTHTGDFVAGFFFASAVALRTGEPNAPGREQARTSQVALFARRASEVPSLARQASRSVTNPGRFRHTG